MPYSDPDYDSRARSAAKVLGARLIRAALNEDTTLYGWVEFAQWSAASPDRLDRQYWYEVRFEPIGKSWKDTWSPVSPSSDTQLNRLHFSVLERTAVHPEGAASVAKLGPIGHIRTNPKSIGLGTYLRDQLIDWVASLHPDASVTQGSLSSVDGGADNLERRNRFYKGGNFQIREQVDGSGAFWADRLDGLRRCTEKSKVVELAKDEVRQLLQCVPELEKAKLQAAELGGKCKRLQTAIVKARVCILGVTLAGVSLFVVLLLATLRGKLSWHVF